MQKVKIAVKGNRAILLGNIELIAGTVGQPCEFYFDDGWDSLQKTITYRLGSNIIGSYAITENKTEIPDTALATAGLPLAIGITGRAPNGKIAIPTSWCTLGLVKQGAVIDEGSGSDDYDEIIYDGGYV